MPAHSADGGEANSPSSTSTNMAVGTKTEEELYAAIGGLEALRGSALGNVPSPTSSQQSQSSQSYISTRDANSTGATFSFDSDMDRYPSSMTSSVRAHVYEGGLRYHAFRDGRYAFPNDEVEQNRDDMKHTMCLILSRGKFFYAPVEDRLQAGAKVLDLGTGTGIWAIELGDKYPAAEITGLDLSPIQPNYVPENVHFFIDDIEEEWVDQGDKYDFIHIRHVLHSLQDTKAVLKQAYNHLKPGGYIEIQELEYWAYCDDDSMTAETPYAWRDFLKYLEQGMRVLGAELHAIRNIRGELTEAGFEDIQAVSHKCPLGVWPRDKRLRLCGLFLRTAIMDGLRGFAQRPLATGLNWTPLQIEIFLVDVRKAVMDSNFHTYYPFHVIYGRKPLDAPS